MARLTEGAFHDIVNSVALGMPRVESVSVSGFQVTVTFESQSKKRSQSWDARINCDPETGSCGYNGVYAFSSQMPAIFARRVSEGVLEVLARQSSRIRAGGRRSPGGLSRTCPL
jgi:hypothetical protein